MDGSFSKTDRPSTKFRVRIYMVMAMFAAFYIAIGVRLVMLGNMERPDKAYAAVPPSVARPDIVDRNNVTLAMDVASRSVYAEPRRIIDVDEAAEGLTSVFPDLDMVDIHKRLASDSGFTWIKRGITLPKRTAFGRLESPAWAFGTKPGAFIPMGPLRRMSWGRST